MLLFFHLHDVAQASYSHSATLLWALSNILLVLHLSHRRRLIFVEEPYLQKALFYGMWRAPNSVYRHKNLSPKQPAGGPELRRLFPGKNRVIALLSLGWAQEQECTFLWSADFFSLVHTNWAFGPFVWKIGKKSREDDRIEERPQRFCFLTSNSFCLDPRNSFKVQTILLKGFVCGVW